MLCVCVCVQVWAVSSVASVAILLTVGPLLTLCASVLLSFAPRSDNFPYTQLLGQLSRLSASAPKPLPDRPKLPPIGRSKRSRSDTGMQSSVTEPDSRVASPANNHTPAEISSSLRVSDVCVSPLKAVLNEAKEEPRMKLSQHPVRVRSFNRSNSGLENAEDTAVTQNPFSLSEQSVHGT